MQAKPTELILDASQALRLASTYGVDVSTPELVETHISRVYLVGDYVYKLKKLVKFDFLDYSTVGLRRQACHEEVRINRRLAPDTYLGVVPVVRDKTGRWMIGESSEEDRGSDDNELVQDWLVKMKRLPEENCFGNRIIAETWTAQDVNRIVDMLSKFYVSLSGVKQSDYVQRFEERVRGNFNELRSPDHELDPIMVERAHAAQMQYLFIHGDLLRQREVEGHLVEGHGDLRADHVYLTDPAVVIDGIEFSGDLRIVDVADELCFFAVTCEALGAPLAGQQVLRGVCDRRRDDPPRSLINFYLAYRASVRAKVAAIQADQRVGNGQFAAQLRSSRFLDLADAYARQLGPSLALIVRGLSGTGKSTVAAQASERFAARHLSTDQIRRNVDSPGGAERYDEASRSKVYETMLNQASEYIADGISVILDGTFLKSAHLRETVERIRAAGIEPSVITCMCPRDVALQRIRARREQGESQSEADESIYMEQEREVELVPTNLRSVAIDTTHGSDRFFTQLRKHLHRFNS